MLVLVCLREDGEGEKERISVTLNHQISVSVCFQLSLHASLVLTGILFERMVERDVPSRCGRERSNADAHIYDPQV